MGFDIDEEIWLEKDDVEKGEDTVVKRGMEWIMNLDDLAERQILDGDQPLEAEHTADREKENEDLPEEPEGSQNNELGADPVEAEGPEQEISESDTNLADQAASSQEQED